MIYLQHIEEKIKMDSDFMEIGETNLVATWYGYLNTLTGEKLDHEGLPLKENDDGTAQES